MIPVRLTDNHYINPSSVAEVEFRPKGKIGNRSLFYASHMNSDLSSVELFDDEAEEAFKNWTAAIAGKEEQVSVPFEVSEQYRNE